MGDGAQEEYEIDDFGHGCDGLWTKPRVSSDLDGIQIHTVEVESTEKF